MIKIILSSFLLLLVTSCKRERTCECFAETGGMVSAHKIKDTKSGAREKCKPSEFGYTGLDEVHCDLKNY